MDEDMCECDEHGTQSAAFVCRHIVAAPAGGTVGFVSAQPDDEDDLRDAWCTECDDYLQSNGGVWIEGE
jgi:hypothetical protein